MPIHKNPNSSSVHHPSYEEQASLKNDHHSHHFPFSSFITRTHFHLLCLILLLFFGLLFSVFLYSDSILSYSTVSDDVQPLRYLYWGHGIDCPGKHCQLCAGLGHQESSLRCALEEAMVLQRTFVMPSRMCINQHHNDKGLLHTSSKSRVFKGWGANSCSMKSLYDLGLMSQTVRVIFDTSNEWRQVLSHAKSKRAIENVQGITREELLFNPRYKEAMVINHTASQLAWFVECKDRKNHTAVLLPYSFLPVMAALPLRMAAEKIIKQLGDYDAIHVRRGDKLKIRKDRFGVNRTLFPHLDRDTQPQAIMLRIADWIPEGRTLFIASNERTPGFFNPLKSKYNVVFSSQFKNILDPIVQNNYQLYIVERLILLGAKTYVRTFKDAPSELSLTDDVKKQIRTWEIPISTFDKR